MYPLILLPVALYASCAATKKCKSVTAPVTIDARQGTFGWPELHSNQDATNFAQRLTSNQGNLTDSILTGYQTVTGTYNISATFCVPDSDVSSSTVQVLIHGIGTDKTYWDIRYGDGRYSYVDVAVDKYGYSTVAIDRLGLADSSHGDPLNLIQAPAEISALYEITKMLRDGTFPTVPTAFKKIVTVGHSFGSIQAYSLSALHPHAQDGIVLTGFSGNTKFMGTAVAAWNCHLARLNQPYRFGAARTPATPSGFDHSVNLYNMIHQSLRGAGLSEAETQQELTTTELANILTFSNTTATPEAQNLPSGYLTWPGFTSLQYTFLHPEFFDIGLGLQVEATKQPMTLGELLTIGSFPSSSSFAGPVQIVTGQQDFIFCGGDCYTVGPNSNAKSIPAQAAAVFPNVTTFNTHIQPNTAHGINWHYNASGAYNVIQQFLTANGLGCS